MNSFAFSGNLGRDCETRFTQSGDAVTGFSVAVKAGFGEKATTTWVNCTMWGKRGEAIAQYLNKGALVGVVGEVSMREWQDKEGQKRTALEVRVNDLTLLSKQERQQAPQQERPPAKKPDPAFDDFESDIPFVSSILDVSDMMGRPKSLRRARRGEEVFCMSGNEATF